MNDITSTIFYDQRICISSAIPTPITWKVTKVDNTNPKGVNTITFAQDRWNEHNDAFEYLTDGTYRDFSNNYYVDKKVIGIYADYYLSSIKPIEDDKDDVKNKIYGEITYNVNPQIKVGGSYKKFTITFYDENGEIPLIKGTWKFELNKNDCSSLLSVIENDNILKVKFVGDDSYIGSVIDITYVTDNGLTTSVQTEVVGL